MCSENTAGRVEDAPARSGEPRAFARVPLEPDWLVSERDSDARAAAGALSADSARVPAGTRPSAPQVHALPAHPHPSPGALFLALGISTASPTHLQYIRAVHSCLWLRLDF